MTGPNEIAVCEAVVFDCGDTLLGLNPPRASICLEALSALGRAFSRREVERAYLCVDFMVKQRSSAMKTAQDRDQFLSEFNLALAMALGLGTMVDAFDVEQRKAFARLRRWEVARGARDVLGALQGEHRLFVLANWDDRLTSLLESLGLAGYFEGIFDSQTLGMEKPDRRIFERFFEAAGVEAASAVYVGNEYRADICGSRAVGMTAVLMDWHGRYGDGVDCSRLTAWDQLPSWLRAELG